MERPPQFLRQFSKQESQPQRDALAFQIREKRRERDERRKKESEKKILLDSQDREARGAKEQKLEELRQLAESLEQISNGDFLSKIMKFFEIKKLRADIMVGETTVEELKEKRRELQADREKIKVGMWVDRQRYKDETEQMLNDFYGRAEEKWVEGEYTQEEVEQYFTEEYLSSLSLEEYTKLLQRFPSEMVTHVTRQGVREDSNFIYHNAGVGDFHHGFTDIAEKGRLLSALALTLESEQKEKLIEEFLEQKLNLKNITTREEAVKALDRYLSEKESDEGGSYSDRSAVHFATEVVADSFYGGETNNEIFFTFPSVFIANEYNFSGNLKDRDTSYWNDQWVYLKEHEGIDINAGVVFVPKNAEVDSQTGSQFEIDAEGHPLPSELTEFVRDMIDNKDLSLLSDIPEVRECASFTEWEQIKNEKIDTILENMGKQSSLVETNKKILEKLLEKISGRYKDFGNVYNNTRVSSTDDLVDRNAAAEMYRNMIRDEATSLLRSEKVYYKKAQNTVSSEAYWEEYFRRNPSKKPSKIYYYDNQKKPTQALSDWKKDNNLIRRAKEEDFEHSRVKKGSQEANQGRDAFRALALDIIERRFSRIQMDEIDSYELAV